MGGDWHRGLGQDLVTARFCALMAYRVSAQTVLGLLKLAFRCSIPSLQLKGVEMALELRKIEVDGNPAVQEIELPVRLTYADAEDLDAATEWLQVQVTAQSGYANVLAEVELDALRRLRKIIGDRIQHLSSLRDQP